MAKDVVIHAGRRINGASATPKRQVSIINRDQRIVGVQNCFVTPAGTEVIDLSSKTVLPGFIDTHDHTSMGHRLHHPEPVERHRPHPRPLHPPACAN
jgi:imidazolonepropionase-like amidohydrolase